MARVPSTVLHALLHVEAIEAMRPVRGVDAVKNGRGHARSLDMLKFTLGW
jgi:hypothetical protein